MKAEIFLTIVWSCLCLSERYHRSTVLTDESKRVVEQFDFSNFDKQEALNYIDRQRYENQIRGKRNQIMLKRRGGGTNRPISEIKTDENENPTKEENEINSDLNYENTFSNYSTSFEEFLHNPGEAVRAARSKKVRNDQKNIKRVQESSKNPEDSEGIKEKKETDENGEKENTKKKKKRRKKKKKRKKRYWGKWTEWSPCSVTCGKGRKIRWRKCIAKNCNKGELEMGEKTCQLPACNLLTKLLGL